MIPAVAVVVVRCPQTIAAADLMKFPGQPDIILQRRHGLESQTGRPVRPPDCAETDDAFPGEELAGLQIGFQSLIHGLKTIRSGQLCSGHHLGAHISFSKDFYRVNGPPDPGVTPNPFLLTWT